MHVVARVKDGDAALVTALEAQGFAARTVKGGVIIELAVVNGKDPEPFSVPDQVNGGPLLFQCVESGGHDGNGTAEATIICGLSGKMLRPFWIPRSGRECDVHARFSVPEKVVVITAWHEGLDNESRIKRSYFVVTKHEVSTEDGQATVKSQMLFKGSLVAHLPGSLKKFADAVEAALAKAECQHCSEPHYAVSLGED